MDVGFVWLKIAAEMEVLVDVEEVALPAAAVDHVLADAAVALDPDARPEAVQSLAVAPSLVMAIQNPQPTSRDHDHVPSEYFLTFR